MIRLLLLVVVLFCVAAEAERHLADVQVEIQEGDTRNDLTFLTALRFTAVYSAIGSQKSASGTLITIHPLGLCNRYTDHNLLPIGWIGVVELDLMSNRRSCSSLYYKAQRAMDRGATAIIYDVSNTGKRNLEVLRNEEPPLSPTLPHPVLLVEGSAARKLKRLLLRLSSRVRFKERTARAFINPKVQGTFEHKLVARRVHSKIIIELGIFATFFAVFCTICLAAIIKLRRKSQNRDRSLASLTKEVVGKLETRLYRTPCQSSTSHYSLLKINNYAGDSEHSGDRKNQKENCAICLDEFKRGEELRIMPCKHEFHKACIDPWLLRNHTCPLCMVDILECPNHETWRRKKMAPGPGKPPVPPVPVLMPLLGPDRVSSGSEDELFDGSMTYFREGTIAKPDFSYGIKNPYYKSPRSSQLLENEEDGEEDAKTSTSNYHYLYDHTPPEAASPSGTCSLSNQLTSSLTREDSSYSIHFNLQNPHLPIATATTTQTVMIQNQNSKNETDTASDV